MLAAALPLIKLLLQMRLRQASVRLDFILTLASFALLAVGGLAMGLSQSWGPFVFGMWH